MLFSLLYLIIDFSLEIRVGNSSEHQDNPLCMWLRGKELSDIKPSENKYLLISCLDDLNTVGRYVSLVSNDVDSPLTLCQGKILICILYDRQIFQLLFNSFYCKVQQFFPTFIFISPSSQHQ